MSSRGPYAARGYGHLTFFRQRGSSQGRRSGFSNDGQDQIYSKPKEEAPASRNPNHGKRDLESSRFEGKEGSPQMNFEFIYEHSPLGPHHKGEFEIDGVKFPCVEQYIRYMKAVMFNDEIIEENLVAIENPSDVQRCRNIKNFDFDEWKQEHEAIVQRAYETKFTQNPELKNKLLRTNGRELVYLGRCRYFGIGITSINDAARDKRSWEGKNILGRILTDLREKIFKKEFEEAKTKFEFFWRKESPFSQWHNVQFWIDNIAYNCAEQYMMFKKAEFFQDWATCEKVLREKSPLKQKALGRQVRRFDGKIWEKHCRKIVRDGNMAKFCQNPDLMKLLLDTHPRELVEASPMDRVWGIGLGKDDPLAWNKKTWKGENRLGQILTEVREALIENGQPNTMLEGSLLGAVGQTDVEVLKISQNIRGNREESTSHRMAENSVQEDPRKKELVKDIEDLTIYTTDARMNDRQGEGEVSRGTTVKKEESSEIKQKGTPTKRMLPRIIEHKTRNEEKNEEEDVEMKQMQEAKKDKKDKDELTGSVPEGRECRQKRKSDTTTKKGEDENTKIIKIEDIEKVEEERSLDDIEKVTKA